jgi:GTP-binding protein
MTGIPIVAIVGRPNVGKSTLFNRILGTRTAIVEDRARTTRDRLYGEAEWNGRRFVIVDTGGLELSPDDPIEAKVQEQARLAIAEADAILFVVEAISGMLPADQEAAEILRTAKAPVLVAVNKADNDRRELEAAEFYAMGWEETYPVSAAHGRGVAELLDALVWALPAETEDEIARKAREVESEAFAREAAAGRLVPFVVGKGDYGDDDDDEDDEDDEDEDDDEDDEEGDEAGKIAARWDAEIAADAERSPAAIAFVGRPNVGKSSLLNALLGEERSIVSAIPGTTRDSIDTPLRWGRSEIVLIDTAGIRRRGRVASGPAAERYSTLRALKAISRSDVAVLVIDAVEGLTTQDAHVAGYVVEEGKGLVVAVNKWDLLEDKTDRTFDQYVEWIRSQAPFLDFAPVISISAKTGQRVSRVLEAAVDIWAERRKRVPTGELNRLVSSATERNVPPMVKGRRPKIFYATQAAVAPPTFVFFANDSASVHFSYRRYLENRLRDSFGFDGTPIRLVFRDRSAIRLPRRKRAGATPTGRRAAAGSPAVRRSRGRPR